MALGACVVEKHLTDDRRRPGPDHGFAMEPAELRAMVDAIRELEAALGDGEKRPRPAEEDERTWARRSVYAARPLGVGARLEARDLKVVRPALGLPPAALPGLLSMGTLSDRLVRRGVARRTVFAGAVLCMATLTACMGAIVHARGPAWLPLRC